MRVSLTINDFCDVSRTKNDITPATHTTTHTNFEKMQNKFPISEIKFVSLEIFSLEVSKFGIFGG